MSQVLLTVTQTGFGTSWDTTWCLRQAASGPDLTENDLATLIAPNGQLLPFNVPTFTDPNDEDYQAENPIQTILALHRLLQDTNVSLTAIYLSDGKKNPGSSVFFSGSINLACLRSITPGNVAPLSICWNIERQPGFFSQKPGRIYLRAALGENEIVPGIRDGVTWFDTTTSAAAITRLNTAMGLANISFFFNTAGEPGSWEIAIPKYAGDNQPNAGQLVGATPIATLVSADPVSRQLTRGKRRKVANGGPSGPSGA